MAAPSHRHQSSLEGIIDLSETDPIFENVQQRTQAIDWFHRIVAHFENTEQQPACSRYGGISGLFGLLFVVGAAKQLYKLHNDTKPPPSSTTITTTSNNQQTPRYPPRKLKITLYLLLLGLLLGLLLVLIRISIILANFATLASTPRNFGPCLFASSGCREAQRQDHEWSLQVGRLSYANAFFTVISRAMLFTVLMVMKRLLLPAEGVSVTEERRRLSWVGDAVQVGVLLALGLATWFTAMGRPEYTITIYGVDTGVEGVDVFAADAVLSKGICLWAAFACWAALMAVPVIASLLRKISHASKADLSETEIHIASVFTKWIVPVLLFTVGLFVVAVFLVIFRKDLSLSATAAPAALEGISSTYGDVVIYGMSLWAAKRLVRLRQEKRQPEPAVAVSQV